MATIKILLFVFCVFAFPDFEKLKVFGLSKCNEIIHDSIAKKRSYIRTYLSLDESKKEEHKSFIKDWSKIIKEVNTKIEAFN